MFLVYGSVVVDSLVISALIVWGCMIGLCFAMHYLVAFQFCNHLVKEEIAGYFTFIVFLLLSVFGALCLFLTVSLVGLQCVIMAFPGHTFFYFSYFITLSHLSYFFLITTS